MDIHDPYCKVLDHFAKRVVAAGKATNDDEACASGAKPFGEWFLTINGELLSSERLTPIDVRQWPTHLLAAKHHKPVNINRELARLSALSEWDQDTGLMRANPMVGLSAVTEVGPVIRWLDKNAHYQRRSPI